MADEELKQAIDSYIDASWEDIVADISALVAISSVEDLPQAQPGAPWGPGPKEALSATLKIAERLGLTSHDCEGYIGYAELPGTSDRYLATISHVDTVPVGNNWNTDPLTLTRRDGYLLGRGVQDDKGPTVLALYAAKFFLEQGIELPYTLRCIIGCNEETGMADVHWYNEHFDQPAFIFTPDGDFPGGCGEKGCMWAAFSSENLGEGRKIISLESGTSRNAIPGVAEAQVSVSANELTEAPNISIDALDDVSAHIVATGVGGHASMPEGTANPIAILVDYLLEHDLCSEAERNWLELERVILGSTDGSTMGIDATDDIFEPLTCIGGTVHGDDNQIVQTIDIRYPKSTTAEELEERLSELARAYRASFSVDHIMVPWLTDPSSEPIQILIDAYNEVFETQGEPFTMGGGTYARYFERGASFGPNEHSVQNPDWVGIEHGENEGMSEELLRKSLKTYILAIARLMQAEL